MKKFLLSAFAVAVAFSAAAFQMLPAQKTFTPKAFTGMKSFTPKHAPKLMKADSKAVSLDDISGTYMMMYYSYFDDFAAMFSEVKITKVSGNTYKISGWWESVASDLTATVNTTDGTLSITRQEVYRYEGDGHIEAADLVNLNLTDEDADLVLTDPLVGQIYQDGIVFENYWGIMITEYSDNGTTNEDAIGRFFSIGIEAYLLEPSGTMSWTPIDASTGAAGDTKTVNVYLEQDADTVFISNFYGLGSTVKVLLAEGRTFTISPQVIYTTSNGDFMTTEVMSWYDEDIYSDITGTGTETTLTDNLEVGWTAGTTTGYWIGWNTNLIITRTDGDVFVWPGEEVVIPDVYILGQVGDNDWAPNVGQQMVYDADTQKYTAEIECKDADNNGYDYFAFTTKLADNADDWDGIAAYRFGAVSNGDFLVTDELLGVELSLTAPGESYQVVKGKYNLTLDYANMKLVIEKVATAIPGDVNGDGDVNVVDITALIDVIMNDITDNDRADVNGDGHIDVVDITALIDIIMNM